MPAQLPAGPYRTLSTPEGAAFPYYIIPFDKDGACTGPLTREHLLTHLDGVTDLFLFSHGWNNDWTSATTRYEDFITEFQRLRSTHPLTPPANYRPLLVGVFWPSQALEWFAGERGPDFAALDPAAQNAESAATQSMLSDIAAQLSAPQRERFYVLASADTLGDGDDRELAEMLAPLLNTFSETEGGTPQAPPAVNDLMLAASALETPEPDYDAVGTAANAGGPVDALAAGVLGGIGRILDPRNLIKPFTVWQMKDRAGTVGALGVGPLLEQILARSADSTRVHLLGHSYGCKVVMTAASVLPDGARLVESALLLQPAISQYAFSESVPDRAVPGGFARNLTRIRHPVMATFSEHDDALHRLFHLSVRRHDDLGELQYAAEGTPSRYAALGGYGPQSTAAAFVEPLHHAGVVYDLSRPARVIGLNGAWAIKGHGDIVSEPICWAAWTLLTAHMHH